MWSNRCENAGWVVLVQVAAYSAGARSPREECGLKALYSSRHASTTSWASSSVTNSSTLNGSSRTSLLNDSMNGFSHGEPGSVNVVLVPASRH